jgi:cardiolipin synthase
MASAWVIRSVVAALKAMRIFPLSVLREATDAALAGMAYDLAYAIEVDLWKIWHRAPTWGALQDGWRASLAQMDLTCPAPAPSQPIRVVSNNAEAYTVRTELYQRATRSIDVSTYAIYGDDTGWKTVRELVDRAKAGIRVRVFVDDGIVFRKEASNPDYAKILDFLRDNGAKVLRYRDPDRPLDMNHRKLLIIDGTEALVGGRNYGDPYAKDAWRDVELLVTGALAADCAAVFDSAWEHQENGSPLRPLRPLASIADGVGRCGEMRGDLAGDNPILLWQLGLIDAAKETIDIENAYVVVLDVVRERLVAAVARGVRVRLFTNSRESNDVKSASHAFFSRFPPLVEGGVELYLRQGEGQTVHSKYMIVDRRFISLGSYNLNAHSARWAAETNLQLDDADTAATLTAFFETGLLGAVRVPSVEAVRAMIPTDPLTRFVDALFLDCN